MLSTSKKIIYALLFVNFSQSLVLKCEKPCHDTNQIQSNLAVTAPITENYSTRNNKLFKFTKSILLSACVAATLIAFNPTTPQPNSLFNIQTLERSKIFEFITGKEETPNIKLQFDQDVDGFYHITNKESHRSFQCGKIHLDSTANWKNKLATITKKPHSGTFNFIYLQGGLNSPLRKFADIAALQVNPSNNDAVFMLASRFNTLESHCTFQRQAGKRPSWYTLNDIKNEPFGILPYGVQGEEGALSCAPGGILRMYHGIDGNTINQLAKIDPTFKLFNPLYPVIPGAHAINTNQDLFSEDWSDKLLVCFHEGIEAVLGLELFNTDNRGLNHSELVNQTQCHKQIIHQIPVSTFNLNYDERPISSQAEQVVKDLLKKTYQAAIAATIVMGKNKLFLTMVGGGVFRNELSWIAEAISACEDLIKDYGLTVYLTAWGNDNPTNIPWFNDEPSNTTKSLQNLVKDCQGNILMLSNNNFILNGKEATSTTEAQLLFDILLK